MNCRARPRSGLPPSPSPWPVPLASGPRRIPPSTARARRSRPTRGRCARSGRASRVPTRARGRRNGPPRAFASRASPRGSSPGSWPSRPPGAAIPRNAVAELPGRDRPGEIVLLAAHLDTVAGSPGANDDAVNAALVLGVARAIRAAGPARRSLRFVLFTGEEEKLLGSRAYVKAHEKELGAHVLAVVYDLGSARTLGFYLNGRKQELRARLHARPLRARGLAQPLRPLHDLGGSRQLLVRRGRSSDADRLTRTSCLIAPSTTRRGTRSRRWISRRRARTRRSRPPS